MTNPVRLRLSRAKGFNLQDHSKAANGLDAKTTHAASQAVLNNISELHGKNLACWCSLDGPCHADILLKLANADQSPTSRKDKP